MQKLCYFCDREVHNYSKKYMGQGYCSTCAARLFASKPCSECGQLYKLPTADKNALCISCIKQSPCIRCNRIGRPIGKITKQGFVCNSCAVHYRKIELCERCQRPSQKLTKITRFNDNLRVCERCATRDYQTCSSCRKYRLLIAQDSGKLICKKCLTSPPAICKKCRINIPAGCGTFCCNCTWSKTLAKRVYEYSKELPNRNSLRYFRKYCVWLEQEIGPKKAALSLKNHLSFFIKTANLWHKNETPSHQQLLQNLQVSNLKTFVLPIRWLKISFNFQIVITVKQFHSEQALIDNLIGKLKGNVEHFQLLKSYESQLANRLNSDRINIRSIRLAIKPASGLLLLCQHQGTRLPNTALTMSYLAQNPSHYAALTGFINFLNKNHETDIPYLQIKNSKFLSNKSKAKLEKEIMLMIAAGNQTNILKWAKLCLRYFHTMNYHQVLKIKMNQVVIVQDGYEIQINNAIYWIPHIPLDLYT